MGTRARSKTTWSTGWQTIQSTDPPADPAAVAEEEGDLKGSR